MNTDDHLATELSALNSSRMEEIVQVQLPPVPPEIVDLLTVESPFGPKADEQLQQSKRTLSIMHRVTELYKNQCEGDVHRNLECIPNAPHTPPSVIFARQKLSDLVVKQRTAAKAIYTRVFDILSLTELFIEKALERRIPVVVNLEGLRPMALRLFQADQVFQKYTKRVKALKSYIEKHKDDKTISEPTLEFCSQLLDDVSRHVDAKFGFAHYSSFDKYLLEYLWSKDGRLIDKVAQALSTNLPPLSCERRLSKSLNITPLATRQPIFSVHRKAKKSIDAGALKPVDTSQIENLYLWLCDRMKADTPSKEVVLKCALVRIVFDRLYLLDPILGVSDEGMIESLRVVRRLSVNDMNVPYVFGDGDQLISDACKSNPLLRELVLFMDSMNFATNPLDLAENISTVANTIEAIRKASAPKGTFMCFDDFFSLFIVVFSSAPPSGAYGIARMFEIYSHINLPGTLKHATTSFCAWVSWLRGFMTAEHPEELQRKIDTIARDLTRV